MFLTEREVAKLTGIAVQTLRNWRCMRVGPPYVKIGRLVRYPKDELDKFMRRWVIRPEGERSSENS